MITLKEAIQLVQLTDDEAVILQNSDKSIEGSTYISVHEIRRRLDMQSIHINHIDVDFSYSGEFLGFVFESKEFIPLSSHWGMHMMRRLV